MARRGRHRVRNGSERHGTGAGASMTEAHDVETGTILIVEDDRANQESLEKIFQREGYRVVLAPDGPAALQLLRRESVEVVLSDLMMPGMSGVELLKAAKAVVPEVE